MCTVIFQAQHFLTLFRLKMTLRLNPADLTDSLVMYTAQNDDGSGDFAALSVKDRHLEFRFDAGTGKCLSYSVKFINKKYVHVIYEIKH